jgi:hypothetical protein
MWRICGFVFLFLVSKANSQLKLTDLAIKPQPFIAKAPALHSAEKNATNLLILKNVTDLTSLKNGSDSKAPKNLTEPVNLIFPDSKDSPFNSSAVPKSCYSYPNPSSADPEKCCSFPDLFPDLLVDQCEKDFGLNISTVSNEMLADSVSFISSESSRI